MPCSDAEITRFVAAQVGALLAVGALVGQKIAYVKPHGALANVAAEEIAVATAIVRAVKAVDSQLAVLAISGTLLENVARDAGIATFSEIFADRGYTPKGVLVPRGTPGAMIEAPDAAATRLFGYFDTGLMPSVGGESIRLAADSVCIHGDCAHAVAMAQHLRAAFVARGLKIAPFCA